MRKLLVASVLMVGVTFIACTESPTDPLGGAPSGPLFLSVVSGNNQTAGPSVELPNVLIASVEDSKGKRVKGQVVNFRVVDGGGAVFAGVAITNNDGIAKERWTLGAAGPQRVEARAIDTETGQSLTFAIFTATLLDAIPPAVTQVAATPNPTPLSAVVNLTATVNDAAGAGSTIAAAEYRLDGGSVPQRR